jgi:hypothetical protein
VAEPDDACRLSGELADQRGSRIDLSGHAFLLPCISALAIETVVVLAIHGRQHPSCWQRRS